MTTIIIAKRLHRIMNKL